MNFPILTFGNAEKMKSHLLIFLVATLSFYCVPLKKTKYLQEEKVNKVDVINSTEKEYKIQPHDVLQITVASMNPQVSEFFNLKQAGEKSSLRNHIVNDSGYIFIPVLDSVTVKGLTVGEAQNLIKTRIRAHVTDATVVVKLASFNVTVLGEVNKPGVVTLDGDQITILQAIGLAGDITEFGNKKIVKLMRKEGRTTRIITLDVSKSNIISSEYFFLAPNDVIYVEPLKAKNFRQNVNQISLILGFTTLFLILYNILK